MDGLLLDSERIARHTFEQTCHQFGIGDRTALFQQLIGITWEAASKRLATNLSDVVDPTAFRKVWDQAYQARTGNSPIPVKDGAIALLEHTEQLGLPCGVATSTQTESARSKLDRAGILKYFSIVIGGDQVRKSKPDPEIYLTAAAALQCEPKGCLALEDSVNGVYAAWAAGMTVVQIPDLVAPDENLRALGHIILGSLHDVLQYPFRP